MFESMICSESREQVEESLKRWRYILERMKWKFSMFKYLGSRITARVEEMIYRREVRPAVMCGLETLALTKRED